MSRIPRHFFLPFALLAAQVAISAEKYAVTPIGNLGGIESFGVAINNNGSATGFADGPVDDENQPEFLKHAFLFDGADIFDLGALNDNEDNNISEARALNDLNDVVGISFVEEEGDEDDDVVTFSQRGFIVPAGGVMEDLGIGEKINNQGTFFDVVNSTANAVNDVGVAVGNNLIRVSEDSDLVARGVVIDVVGAPVHRFIKNVDDNENTASSLLAVSDTGIAVGFTQDDETNEIDAIRVDLSDVNLQAVLVNPEGALQSRGIAVNSAGDVAGNILDQNNLLQGFLQTAEGDTVLIGRLGNNSNTLNPFSQALGVNNAREVVGFSNFGADPVVEHGVIFDQTNGLRNLSDLVDCEQSFGLVRRIVQARSINATGQIAATALIQDLVDPLKIEAQAVILTPVLSGTPVPCGE